MFDDHPTSVASPSAKRELQKYATSRSHEIRFVDPSALVGQRVRVFDDHNTSARSGVVRSTKSKLGDSTRHEILFDGSPESEMVLLQKKAGGKGRKFHVLTDTPTGSKRLSAAGTSGGDGAAADGAFVPEIASVEETASAGLSTASSVA